MPWVGRDPKDPEAPTPHHSQGHQPPPAGKPAKGETFLTSTWSVLQLPTVTP